MTLSYDDLRKKWNRDPRFRDEVEALEPEFRLARDLIKARTNAGMNQSEVAVRMGAGTARPADRR